MRIIWIAALCALTVLGQSDGPKPDRWHGLVLNETTQAQAIEILGQPKESKPRKLRAMKIGDWLSKTAKEDMPSLHWEKIEGMNNVDAFFLNNKLVALQLDLKTEVRASTLETIYGVEFVHLISNAGRELAGPGAYQRDRGQTYSNKAETAYNVGAKTERAFVVAFCLTGFGEGLKQAYGAGTDITRPGRVRVLQFISRELENRDGASALK